MAAIANLSIDQGATFSSDVTIKDANNALFDLTGYTARAKMALGYASTRTRVTITATVNSDPTTGIVTLSLTDTQTADLEAPARYVYDLEVVSSGGSVTRVIEGIINIRPNVTI